MNWWRAGLEAAEWLVGRLPYRWLQALGGLLGGVYFLLAVRQRRRAYRQIVEHLEVDGRTGRQMTAAMCRHIGKMLLEILYIPRLVAGDHRRLIKISGEDNLRAALAKGQGAILLSAHLGNWEWLGAGLALRGWPVATLVRSQGNRLADDILHRYRTMAGMVCHSTGGNEMVAVARALKRGMAVGFIADKDAGVRGVWTDFFRRKASTPVGAVFFARRFGVDILPVFIYRREGGHEIIIQPPLRLRGGNDRGADLTGDVQLTSDAIEQAIRRQPTDWLWLQKRWNTVYNEHKPEH
ncbi:MAG: lysophospholipid acyltransferase family protein [Negativicutes bacterium]|nr:lysophospholipid acyltransferase family protein [Negativicutes bacterium]